MKCPNCGAESNRSFCEYCGTRLPIAPQRKCCAKCGSTNISFSREKQGEVKVKRSLQVVRKTVGVCKNCGYTWYTDVSYQAPKKNNMVWWVLGWIFFFPIPLTILILRNKRMKPAIKYTLVALLWILFIIVGKANQTGSASITITPANPVSNTSVVETTVATTEASESDLDIILRSGHPTYYGSNTQAHEVWKDVEKGKIQFADDYKYSTKDTKPIIYLEGYNSDKYELIKGVGIRLYNSEELQNGIALDEALKIASDYLPYDIIEKWYKFNRSFCIIPKDGKEQSEIDYFVCYGLTEEGSNAYYAKEHQYSGSIDINLSGTDEEHITYVGITFGTPKWVGFLDTNGKQKIEWEYDFLTAN